MPKTIKPEELKKQNTKTSQIIDIREKEEVKLGKIENSINIPIKELPYKLDKINKNNSLHIL